MITKENASNPTRNDLIQALVASLGLIQAMLPFVYSRMGDNKLSPWDYANLFTEQRSFAECMDFYYDLFMTPSDVVGELEFFQDNIGVTGQEDLG